MSVKKLLELAPELCGAVSAKKHSRVAGIVFEVETAGKEFKREPGESPEDRIGFLFDWPGENEKKREYCKKLATLAVASHYAIEHMDVDAMVEAEAMKVELEADEALYPDVKEVFSVATAARGGWY